MIELQKTWSNILQQYSEAIGSGEYKVYLNLYREVSLLTLDYESISVFVGSMRSIQQYMQQVDYHCSPDLVAYHKKIGAHLNMLLKSKCSFNVKDPITYEEELKKCLRRAGSLKIKLDLKLIAFKAIQQKNKEGQAIDRAYFDSMLITISDYAKYEINESITVSKYCERIKRYNQYCESLKKGHK